MYGAPFLLFHRVDLHNELKKMALEPRPSTSRVAKLHLLSAVKDVELDGTMMLENGTKVHKDLIIVADGVHVRLFSLVSRYSLFLSSLFSTLITEAITKSSEMSSDEIRRDSGREACSGNLFRRRRFSFPHPHAEAAR